MRNRILAPISERSDCVPKVDYLISGFATPGAIPTLNALGLAVMVLGLFGITLLGANCWCRGTTKGRVPDWALASPRCVGLAALYPLFEFVQGATQFRGRLSAPGQPGLQSVDHAARGVGKYIVT